MRIRNIFIGVATWLFAGIFVFAGVCKPAVAQPQDYENVHGFYYYFDSLYLSRGITIPISFGLRGEFPSQSNVRMILETPKSISWHGNNIELIENFEIEGKAYQRFKIPTNRIKSYYSTIRLTVSAGENLQENLPVYYYAEWDSGKQPKQTLPIEAVQISEPPQLKQILVGLELNSMTSHYPELASSFKKVGMNYVAGGIVSWGLGMEPRKPKGAYNELINQLEEAGITVSTGNIGSPFNRFKDIINGNKTAYEIAGTLHYPQEQFNDFDIEDLRATDIEGKKLNGIDPSYRGPYFDKVLDNVKLLIDYGYKKLLYDEETWAMPPEVGYSERSRAKFTQFLSKNYPDLEPMDPRIFAKTPQKYPELMDAWWEFRTSLVADIYQQIKKTAIEHGGPDVEVYAYVSASAWYPKGEKQYKAITHRLTDYRQLAQGVDAMPPMVYTRNLKESANVGRIARFIWERTHQNAKVFMALSPARMYEYDRLINHDYPPAVAIKYQLYEAVSQGVQGILIWAPNSDLEGALSLRYMSQAISAIAPVEDIIVKGTLIDPPTISDEETHAQGITFDGKTVMLVANYTAQNPIDVSVTYKDNAANSRTVKDLETGAVIATIDDDGKFQLSLGDEHQARLLLIE